MLARRHPRRCCQVFSVSVCHRRACAIAAQDTLPRISPSDGSVAAHSDDPQGDAPHIAAADPVVAGRADNHLCESSPYADRGRDGGAVLAKRAASGASREGVSRFAALRARIVAKEAASRTS